MTNQEILQIALQQSAYDCNCNAEDFLSTENKVVLSQKNEKARVYMRFVIFLGLSYLLLIIIYNTFPVLWG